jgi:hypothetical protein
MLLITGGCLLCSQLEDIRFLRSQSSLTHCIRKAEEAPWPHVLIVLLEAIVKLYGAIHGL